MFNLCPIEEFVIFDNVEAATIELNRLYEDKDKEKQNEHEYWIEIFEKNEKGGYVSSGNYIKQEYK